jgi:hypothetical protein
MIKNNRILNNDDWSILALVEKAVRSKHHAALANAEFAKMAKNWPVA